MVFITRESFNSRVVKITWENLMKEAKLKESQWEYSNFPAKISMKVILKNYIHTREYALKYHLWMELESFNPKMVHATLGIS